MREHISGQYDAELDELRAMVTEMGGLVERQLQAVCLGLGHLMQILRSPWPSSTRP